MTATTKSTTQFSTTRTRTVPTAGVSRVVAEQEQEGAKAAGLAGEDGFNPWAPGFTRRVSGGGARTMREVVNAMVARSFGNQNSSSLSTMLRLSEADTFTRPYVQAAIVYACVEARARAVLSMPIEVWDGECGAEGSTNLTKERPDDPVVQLLNKPNALMSGRKFMRAMSAFHSLAGGSFLFLNHRRGSGFEPVDDATFPREGVLEIPDEIWPVREDLVEPVYDEGGGESELPVGWQFQSGQEIIRYPWNAVSHLYEQDPNNPLRGVGPMQAAYRRAAVAHASEAFDQSLAASGGQMGGYFTRKEKQMRPAQRQQMEEAINAALSDTGHRGIPVLPMDVDFTQMAYKPLDMEFGKLKEWTRDEIQMVFGCTNIILGLTDNVQRGNARVAKALFYENTVIPFFQWYKDEIERELFARLRAPFNDYRIGWDESRVPALQEETGNQIERLAQLMKLGFSVEESLNMIGWRVERGIIADLDRRITAESPDTAEPDDDGDGGGSPPTSGPGSAPEEDDKGGPVKVVREFASRLTREQRINYSLAFNQQLTPAENQLQRRVNAVYRKWLKQTEALWVDLAEGRRALVNGSHVVIPESRWMNPETRQWMQVRNITPDEIERLLLGNKEQWNREVWRAMEQPLQNIQTLAGSSLAAELGSVFPTTSAPEMLQYMADKQLLIVEGITNPLYNQVRGTIIRVFAEGGNIGTLRNRLTEVLSELRGHMGALRDSVGRRAAAIARTETTGAANGSRIETLRAASIAEHEWLSAGDDLVRDGHTIDGEVAQVGSPFSNSLRYPGDPNVGAALVVNCRCTTLAVLPEQPE